MISDLSEFERDCLEPGMVELLGQNTDLTGSTDTINSSYNSNKCPPPPTKHKRTSKAECRTDMLELSKVARVLGLLDLARKFEYCSTDVIVLRDPVGSISITPLRCNHKLCPLCHAYHAQKIKSRLEEVAHRAKTMITLTIATYHDYQLRENIKIIRRAFRLMCQRKKKNQWIPFEPGYFWRLELTDGKGFHPHLHVLSTHEWIDYHRLRDRWRACIDLAGGKGDHLWISKTDKNTCREVCKYLSKDIDFIASKRWPELNDGLYGVRTYGSGRALTLPPLESRGKKFICFGKDIDYIDSYDILEDFKKTKPGSRIRPDSKFQERWKDDECFEEYYGV